MVILTFKRFVIVGACALALSACTAREERAATGAGIGAVGGAIIGGLATGRVGGAVAGGVIGAAGGALIADATRPRSRSRYCRVWSDYQQRYVTRRCR
jgi:osmotically inducible lipoprotein OsmB